MVSVNLLGGRVLFVAVCLLIAVPVGAQTITLTQLFAFGFDPVSGLLPNGYEPDGTLIQASDGNFYGTTSLGGNDGHGCLGACLGTVFKITPAGQLTVLFTFPPGGSLGAYPLAGLVEARDGYLYGTTNSGGNGGGTLFRLSKSGTFTLLHNFCANPACLDGAGPRSLIQAKDGVLYGAAGGGGANGMGAVFRITTAGAYTLLHSMNGADGCSTYALIQASDSNFYGVNSGCGLGGGTIFRITSHDEFTVLHNFGATPDDGSTPLAPLMQASDGTLYGTTNSGGANGKGTVFGIDLSGDFKVLYNFLGGADGAGPWAGLIQASDGNVWGTTFAGGTAYGTVFAVSTGGTLMQALPFDYLANGCCAYAGLVEGAGGALYGTAGGGGTDTLGNPADGTVFTIKTGWPAPKPRIAGFAPEHGAPGSKVLIEGSRLIGTSRVAFNGADAAFKVNNANYITVVVPVGATTGPIAVTNRGGTTVGRTFRVP